MNLLRLLLFAVAALLLAACASRKYDVDKAMKEYNRTFENLEKKSKKQKKATDKSFGSNGDNNKSTW